MKSQTLSKEEELERQQELVKAARLLERSRHFRRVAKRERMIKRMYRKSQVPKTRKPKRADRDEIVARQKKFRAPIRPEE